MFATKRTGLTILVTLIALTFQPPSISNGAPQNVSLSASELQSIIREAFASEEIVPELSAYVFLQHGCSSLQSSKSQSGQPTTARVKIARGKYVVIEHRKTADDRLVLTEVIAHDEPSMRYRRWRLVPGKPTVKLVGVGDAEALSPKTKPVQTRTIRWSTLPDPTVGVQNQIEATETIVLDTVQNRCHHSWAMKVTRVGLVIDSGKTVMTCHKFDRTWPKIHSAASTPNNQVASHKTATKHSTQRSAPLKSKEYRFEEQNFVLKDPRAAFVRSRRLPLGVTQNLRLLLNRRTPQASIAVIAEKMPYQNAMTIDQVVETAVQHVRRKTSNRTFSRVNSVAHNGIAWEQFSIQVDGDAPSTQIQSLAVSTDYIYQILVTCHSTDLAATKRLSDRVVAGFELIDKSPITKAQFVTHEDHRLGINAIFSRQEFPHVRKVDAYEINPRFPGASFGAVFPHDQAVLIFPVEHGDLEVNEEILREVIAAKVRVVYPTDVTKSEVITCGLETGTQLTAVYTAKQGMAKTCVMRVFPRENVSVGVVAIAVGDTSDLPSHLAKKLDAFTLKTPAPDNKPELQRPGRHLLINDIGVQHSLLGDFETALPFFQLAFKISNDDITVGSNVADTLISLGEFEDSLQLTNQLLKKAPLETHLLSLKAANLLKLGRNDDSIKVYQSLANRDSLSDDDLTLYMSLLVKIDRASDALAVTEKLMNTKVGRSVATRRWHSIMLRETGKIDESIRVARQLADDFPNNVELAEDVVIRLIDSDRSREVITEVATLKSKGITSATLLYNKGLAHLAEEDYSQAKSAFESALELAPGEAVLSDAISQTSAMLGQGDNSAIKRPIDPVEIPTSVSNQLASCHAEESLQKGFSYQTVSHVTGINFKRGQPLRTTDYREIRLQTKAGADDLKTIQVSFDPVVESIYVNELSVLDPQGKVVAQGRLQDYYITSDTSQGFASSDRTLNLPVPGLKPGHTIRYSVTRERISTTDNLPFKRYTFASVMPSGARTVFVSGDIDELKSGHANGPFLVDRSDTVASWILAEPPMFYLEGFQPSFDTFLPNIWMGGKTDTWETVGTQYLEKLESKMTPSPEAARLARTLTENHQDETQKSLAILQWIERETVYQALEFGVRGQIPNDASQTIHNRFGDCKDLSLLAWQILRAAGVECHLALVQSYGNIVSDVPTLDQFDHMILYLPNVRGGCFVDCTSRDVLPWQSASLARHNRKALVLEPSNVRLQTSTSATNRQSTLHCEREVFFENNQRDLSVEETLTVEGPLAASFRSLMRKTNPAELKSVFQSALTPTRRINIDHIEFENVERLEYPVEVRMKYKLPRAIKKRGSKLLTSLPAIWEKYCFEIDASSERKTPFELDTTLEFVSTTKLQIPNKLTLVETPDSYSHTDDWTDHTIRVSSRDGNIVCRTKLIRKASGLFPPEKYDSFLDSIETTLDAASVPLMFR